MSCIDFSRRGVGLCVLLIGSLFFGNVYAQKIRIDQVDVSRFEEENTIRFFVDLLERDGTPAKDVNEDEFTFSIDDEEIPGTVATSAFFDTSEQAAITIVLAAHGDYLAPLIGETSPFDLAVEGMARFVGELRPVDRVSLWCYTDRTFRRVSAFTLGGQSTADEFIRDANRVCRPEMGEDKTGFRTPSLFRELLRAVQGDFRDDFNNEETARQRAIVLMSDGNDNDSQTANGPSRIQQYIKDIQTEIAGEIKFYVVAYATLDDRGYTYLGQLAKESNGGIRELPTELEEGMITREWLQLVEVIKRQVIVDFVPEDLDGGRGVKFQLSAVVQGSDVSAVHDRFTKLPSRPFAWLIIAYWIGGILGIGLLLFGLIRLVRMWMDGRGAIEGGGGHGHEPSGPIRGKLTVIDGPYTGEVFYLVDEVTTIGSMDGNDIIIRDSGISKRHFGIKIEDMRYELADFGSTNGVSINGRKAQKQFLKAGDTIRAGNTEMVFALK